MFGCPVSAHTAQAGALSRHHEIGMSYRPLPLCAGCRGPPNVTLTNGVWSCSGKVPVGGKCTGKCNGVGALAASLYFRKLAVVFPLLAVLSINLPAVG